MVILLGFVQLAERGVPPDGEAEKVFGLGALPVIVRGAVRKRESFEKFSPVEGKGLGENFDGALRGGVVGDGILGIGKKGAGVYVGGGDQGEIIIVDQERIGQGFAEAVEGGAKGLLGGGAVQLRPEEGEEVIARLGIRLGGEVIQQGAAFSAGDL